jgi:hypothetical protein
MAKTQRKGTSLPSMARALFERIEKALTAYDLFAITVTYMVFGHYAENFTDSLWLRVGDRILVPVFLIPIGYNVGRKLDWKLICGALLVAGMRWFMFQHWLKPLPMGGETILVTIVVTRLILPLLMDFVLQSRWRFWSANLVLAALAPWTHGHISEYGTLGVILAMAGWLSRARSEIPRGIVDVREYFVLAFFYYIAFNQSLYGLSPVQLAVTAAGTALAFGLLYDFRKLIQNSLKRKSKDAVSKICRFVGGNSLEIYTLHMIVYYGVFYYALSVPG